MTDSILQSFLDNRFIKTDDSEHIENLKKVSDAVQKLLKQKKNKSKIISYTLVALDPTISNDDPVVVEVEGLIIKQWSTFQNSVVKTKDTPIVYVQAVILDALSKLSKDDDIAAIIWHTGCNIINYYKLARQEEVLTHFLLEIGKKVEEIGRNSWSTLESATIDIFDPIEFTLPKISQGNVNASKLQAHLMAASAQQGQGGENPQFASHNTAAWPSFFSERAAKGLSEEINAVLSDQSQSLTSIQEFIDEYFANLKPQLEQVASSILQSSKSLNKRTNLLWWKQSLYSPRLESSYRALDPLTLTVAMAVDLADNVSPIYPRSVDFFLKETLRDALDEKSEEKTGVVELLKQLQQLPDDEKQLLKGFSNENEGRKSLGACVADIVEEKMNTDEFFNRAGLEEKAKISLGELTVWLFHDLQANTLVNTK